MGRSLAVSYWRVLFAFALMIGLLMKASDAPAQNKVVIIPLPADGIAPEDCIQDTGDVMTGTLTFQVPGFEEAVDAVTGGTAIQGVSITTGSSFVTYGGYFEGHTETGAGVRGFSDGSLSSGVEGIAGGAGGRGVYGEGKGINGIGVWGKSAGNNVDAVGVYGESVYGDGVRGKSINSRGIYGESTNGRGVQGSSTSSLGVYGVSESSYGVRAESTTSSAVYALTKGGNEWQCAVYGKNDGLGTGVYGWSTNENGVTGVTLSSSHAAVDGLNNNANGGTGIYGQGVARGAHGKTTGIGGYGVYGEATAQDGYGGFFSSVVNNPTGHHSWGVYAQALGSGGIGIQAQGALDGSGYAAVFEGKAKCEILEITGADLSEEYGIRGTTPDTSPSSGMVVSIDPENPGELIVSHVAYDRKVAGVISGAGGIRIGLVMGKENTAENSKQPVALTGRVYCRADASRGAIAPGDLLTTSDTPGHAMKVLDYPKAQGAILGKAMSGLDSGKGLVLVLVSLQ